MGPRTQAASQTESQMAAAAVLEAAPDEAPTSLAEQAPGTDTAPTATAETLSAQLSSSSKALHRSNTSLVQGRLVVLFTDRALYGAALACFAPVFRTLEEQLRLHKDNADIAACWTSLEPMFRTQGFEKDLEFYLGPTWREQPVNSAKATAAYVAHLKALGERDATLLLAHAFTQLLGLASGGQVIKRWARRRLHLPDDQGTAAFDYPHHKGSPEGLKNAFKAQLNALGDSWTPERRLELVAEHHVAFNSNSAIISEFRVGWWNFWRGLAKLVNPWS